MKAVLIVAGVGTVLAGTAIGLALWVRSRRQLGASEALPVSPDPVFTGPNPQPTFSPKKQLEMEQKVPPQLRGLLNFSPITLMADPSRNVRDEGGRLTVEVQRGEGR